jgi:acetate kinase
LLNWIWSGKIQVVNSIKDIDIVGHRAVYGGDKYHQPILINPEVKAEIDRLARFLPLHVSGMSNDLREIDKAIAAGNTRAKLALDIYIDRLTSKIGSLLPTLERSRNIGMSYTSYHRGRRTNWSR